MATTLYTFGKLIVDERLYQLRRGKDVIRLEPKVFDFLLFLLRNRDRVCGKDELLDALWPGESVSESVLPTNVAAVRRALRGDPVGKSAIQTVHGRGYRFVAPVAERRSEDALAARSRDSDAATAPFIGRESALAQLDAALEGAMAGDGRLVLLVGEPGIGKTFTAAEAARRAATRGAEVLTGRCYEGAGAPAFWPWQQILRQSLRDGDAAELTRALGPEAVNLAGLLPELPAKSEPTPLDTASTPEQARFRFFDGITRYFEARSRERPLVLNLDDLHWADKASLLLLQHLNRELPSLHVLVVGSYREIELRRDRALAGVLGVLGRESHCTRISLGGFSRAELTQFVEANGHEDPDPSFLEAVFEMTAGNPFFVGEVVALWSGEGLDLPDANAALPQGVREAVGRRLDSVSDECNRVLRFASVLGRDIRLEMLAGLADVSRTDLLSVLDEGVAARLLKRSGVGEYSFTHALIRETLYEELSTPKRIGLHRRAAELLERAEGPAPANLAELAHHLFQATPGGDIEKAVSVCVAAADQCMRVLAFEESALQYERALQALEMLPAPDAARQCELLLALSEAQDRASEYAKSSETGKRATDRARAAQRADLLARAALAVRGSIDMRMPYAAGCAALEEALDRLGDEHSVLRCRVLARLSQTPPYRDDVEDRNRLSLQAIAIARELGDDGALLEALTSRLYPALLGPDDDEIRLEVTEELIAVGQRTASRRYQLVALESRSRSNLSLGNMAAVDRDVEEYLRLAESERDLGPIFFGSFAEVARCIGDGRFAAAQAAIERCRERGERLAHFSGMSADGPLLISYWQKVWMCVQSGDFDEIPDLDLDLEDSMTAEAPIRELVNATVDLGRGDRDAARDAYELAARRSFEDLPKDEWWMAWICLMAELTCEFDDRPRAERLYPLLLPYAELNAVHMLMRTYAGSVERFLGLLAHCCDRRAAAKQHFDAALEANKRMGARPALAWTWLAYGRLLLASGADADRERALTCFERSADEANALGMKQVAQEAAAARSAAR